MMKIVWEFDGDDIGKAAAQAAVGRILERYKRALNSLTCPTHREVPVLRVRGRSLDDLDVHVEACCQFLTDDASARIRRTSAAIPRKIRSEDIPDLRDAVRRIHGCPATYCKTERVREISEGKESWSGDVAVFDILGHPTAMVCYAWCTQSEGSGRPRYHAVLKGGAVRSSLDAVRASTGQSQR